MSQLVGGRAEEAPERIATLMERLKKAEKELAAVNSAQALAKAGQLVECAEMIDGKRCVIANCGQLANVDDLRTLGLDIRARLGEDGPAVVALIAEIAGKPMVVVGVNKQAQDDGVAAGALVKQAATVLGGGGGGRPDFAQGGGQNIAHIDAALDSIRSALAQ